jgi:hypothetical protein
MKQFKSNKSCVMKKAILTSSMMLLFSAFLFTGCNNAPKTPPPAAASEPTPEQLIKRGEYLVTIMGCNDCHSPKQITEKGPVIIKELMLSGYPADRPVQKADPRIIKQGWNLLNYDFTSAAGQWGVSFAGNLTSDQTGIGNWPEENFKRALKEGKYKGLAGSRTLLPPMPWTNFAGIEDYEVKTIFAYLKSVAPVKNVVPMPISPEDL